MQVTFDREKRRQQKEMLKGLYPDYNVIHHDIFVDRYNKESEKKNLQEYMKNRGLI